MEGIDAECLRGDRISSVLQVKQDLHRVRHCVTMSYMNDRKEKTVTIRVADEVYAELQRRAKEMDVSISWVIRKAIADAAAKD